MIVYGRAAQRDLAAIRARYAELGGRPLVERAREALAQAERQMLYAPYAGTLINRSRGSRRLVLARPLASYGVYYVPPPPGTQPFLVLVLAVLHLRRDPTYVRRRTRER